MMRSESMACDGKLLTMTHNSSLQLRHMLKAIDLDQKQRLRECDVEIQLFKTRYHFYLQNMEDKPQRDPRKTSLTENKSHERFNVKNSTIRKGTIHKCTGPRSLVHRHRHTINEDFGDNNLSLTLSKERSVSDSILTPDLPLEQNYFSPKRCKGPSSRLVRSPKQVPTITASLTENWEHIRRKSEPAALSHSASFILPSSDNLLLPMRRKSSDTMQLRKNEKKTIDIVPTTLGFEPFKLENNTQLRQENNTEISDVLITDTKTGYYSTTHVADLENTEKKTDHINKNRSISVSKFKVRNPNLADDHNTTSRGLTSMCPITRAKVTNDDERLTTHQSAVCQSDDKSSDDNSSGYDSTTHLADFGNTETKTDYIYKKRSMSVSKFKVRNPNLADDHNKTSRGLPTIYPITRAKVTNDEERLTTDQSAVRQSDYITSDGNQNKASKEKKDKDKPKRNNWAILRKLTREKILETKAEEYRLKKTPKNSLFDLSRTLCYPMLPKPSSCPDISSKGEIFQRREATVVINRHGGNRPFKKSASFTISSSESKALEISTLKTLMKFSRGFKRTELVARLLNDTHPTQCHLLKDSWQDTLAQCLYLRRDNNDNIYE